ncbi:MAG TPA: FAD-dependent oxidoreductase [Anaerolineales bacterium]
MTNDNQEPQKVAEQNVAVIGAGPAGLYAARQLAQAGVRVVLLNRDIKPGGLAEYGIYHDKHKMKEGLRKQFRQILDSSQIEYFGNVTIGEATGLKLEDLKSLGFHTILVTAGAQGTKWLGLPGEDLTGVYHAKDLVYHYNRLPPYSTAQYQIGKRVALIGAGNVMLDIAHWVIRDLKVDEVIAVVRRGPAEVKFSKKEMEAVARNLDLDALDAEINRTAPIMQAVGQDIAAAKDFILSALPKALVPISRTRFHFDFLASPTRIVGDQDGRVCGLEVEDTTLLAANGDTKARGLGTHRVLNVDTVVFCIGDRVDEYFGLPVQWNEFVKNPKPAYPVDGLSYEAYDPKAGKPIEGVFVAGWSREASSGLVGVARKDGENGAKAVMEYLQSQPTPASPGNSLQRLKEKLGRSGKPVITKEDVQRLEAAEQAEAARQGLEEFKFKSNDEMLAVIGKK